MNFLKIVNSCLDIYNEVVDSIPNTKTSTSELILDKGGTLPLAKSSLQSKVVILELNEVPDSQR